MFFVILGFVASCFLPFSSLSMSFWTIFILLMAFIFTATTGYIIRSKNEVKFYMRALGLELGSWKEFKGFSCLVLKTTSKKRENSIVNIIGDSATVTERFTTTEIYMMDSTHRKKLMCGSFEFYDDAIKFAKEISRNFNFPIQKFSPKRVGRRS